MESNNSKPRTNAWLAEKPARKTLEMVGRVNPRRPARMIRTQLKLDQHRNRKIVSFVASPSKRIGRNQDGPSCAVTQSDRCTQETGADNARTRNKSNSNSEPAAKLKVYTRQPSWVTKESTDAGLVNKMKVVLSQVPLRLQEAHPFFIY
jgi:hypothetical protein